MLDKFRYKLCLTETCEDDVPNLITHVETVPATTPDVALTEPVHTALAVKELLPSEHLVDVGFVNADHLVHSRTQQDVEIVGPVLRNTAWQANSAQGLDVAQFVIDWAAQTVTCPQGHVSHSWVTSHSRGRPVIHVRFGHQDCLACPARAQCTRTQRHARTIHLVPQEQFLALQHAREYQTTEAFKRRYAKRAGIEGTISQAVHAGDSRVSRYIGLAKTHLQHLATAAAINLARIVDWVTCPVKASTRVSRFAALAPATPALIL
jgi:transposase